MDYSCQIFSRGESPAFLTHLFKDPLSHVSWIRSCPLKVNKGLFPRLDHLRRDFNFLSLFSTRLSQIDHRIIFCFVTYPVRKKILDGVTVVW